MSRAELARKARLSIWTVGQVERTGYATPRTVSRLAKALGVPPDALRPH